MNRAEYPDNWEDISRAIIQDAHNACELCGADNHKSHWRTGSKVVLTVHHIDRDKKNNCRLNLIALCQRCHLRLDLEYHIRKARQTKQKRMLLRDMFGRQRFDGVVIDAYLDGKPLTKSNP